MLPRLRRWLLIALSVLVAAPGVAELSREEQEIVAWIETHNGEALELLERVVDINSGTMNFAGVREVGEIFAAELEDLGFQTEWLDGVSFGRAGHLIARWSVRQSAQPPDNRGVERIHFLLIGHLDTVFEQDSPFQSYELLDGNRASGPGTTDMKGGDVVLIQALRALEAIGALDEVDVTVVMTGDEERSGRPLEAARAVLVDSAKVADVAIGFEDGDGDPETAVISRRGSGSWTLTVKAKPAHSSQIFQPKVGAGAIYEAARILTAFREDLRSEENLTCNPGVILGGTDVEFDAGEARGGAFGKNNVIAEHAVVTGDLRATSPAQYERATRRMREIVAHNLPHAQTELTFSPSYPPMGASDGNRRLLALYDEVSRDLGYGPVQAVNPRNAGAADVSFAAEYVEMALDGVGLMGEGGHTVDEVADLSTLPMQVQRAAVLMLRLARRRR
ncbi:MAG: M20 family metallopeptidase [bacterium]|nr:M20 family metallopeptidase [bacterium]